MYRVLCKQTVWSTSLFWRGVLHVSPSILLVRSIWNWNSWSFRNICWLSHVQLMSMRGCTVLGGIGLSSISKVCFICLQTSSCDENARSFASFQLDGRWLRFWVTALKINNRQHTNPLSRGVSWLFVITFIIAVSVLSESVISRHEFTKLSLLSFLLQMLEVVEICQ